jgi:hypothetical protein
MERMNTTAPRRRAPFSTGLPAGLSIGLSIGLSAGLLLATSTASGLEPPAASPPATPAPAPTTQTLPPAFVREMDGGTVVEQLRAEAAQVLRRVQCDTTRRLLINTSWLPVIEKRRVHRDKAAGVVLSPARFDALPADAKSSFEAVELNEEFFYFTSYGSPLAYARPLDLVAKQLGCTDMLFAGKRILDFGYGGIGHLRLLASVGAHVTGVEINPLYEALYSEPGDTGEVPGAGISDPKPPAGSITLVTGSWPSDPAVTQRVGGGYDLIISKNVLKKGYIHPAKEVPDRQRVKLGVDDAGFLKAVADSLNEGGLFMIYNICPKQREDKYIPWADGLCPFSREAVAAAGLEVLAFDVDDSVEVRLLGKALSWDQGPSPMDLENDCFAWYTLIRKPTK